jgi:hypothetical protein
VGESYQSVEMCHVYGCMCAIRRFCGGGARLLVGTADWHEGVMCMTRVSHVLCVSRVALRGAGRESVLSLVRTDTAGSV